MKHVLPPHVLRAIMLRPGFDVGGATLSLAEAQNPATYSMAHALSAQGVPPQLNYALSGWQPETGPMSDGKALNVPAAPFQAQRPSYAGGGALVDDYGREIPLPAASTAKTPSWLPSGSWQDGDPIPAPPQAPQGGMTYMDAAKTVAGNMLGGVKDAATLPGDVYAGRVDPMSDQGIARANNLATMLTGNGMGAAEDGAAGIFGGRLSKTADLDALSKAQDMHAAGAPRDAIWNDTGWFQGPDKQWRYEIPDDKSAYKPDFAGTKLPDAVAHSDLYDAYPHLKDVAAAHPDTKGWDGERAFNGLFSPEKNEISVHDELGAKSGRSTGLHEIQHVIQDHENLAEGGNPNDFIYQNSPLFSARRSYESPADAYKRLAGEVEARNVQSRRDLTPEQRRASPPWETQDVPDDQQIVRMGSSGPQMSASDDALQSALSSVPPSPSFTAYHGSPHSFDQFDISKIGTGEGAQAYGHGLYFAGNEGVARSYRDALSSRDNPKIQSAAAKALGTDAGMGPDVMVADALNKASDADHFKSILSDHVDRGLAKDPGSFASWEAGIIDNALKSGKLDQFYNKHAADARGSMYEARINADPEHFLDWDKPVVDQHPDVVKNLEKVLGPGLSGLNAEQVIQPAGMMYRDPAEHSMSNWLGTPEQISSKLRDAGIPGIKYKDAGSRGTDSGNGTHNYVVFDDKTIDILRKYGLAGVMAGGAGAAGVAGAVSPDGKPSMAHGGGIHPAILHALSLRPHFDDGGGAGGDGGDGGNGGDNGNGGSSSEGGMSSGMGNVGGGMGAGGFGMGANGTSGDSGSVGSPGGIGGGGLGAGGFGTGAGGSSSGSGGVGGGVGVGGSSSSSDSSTASMGNSMSMGAEGVGAGTSVGNAMGAASDASTGGFSSTGGQYSSADTGLSHGINSSAANNASPSGMGGFSTQGFSGHSASASSNDGGSSDAGGYGGYGGGSYGNGASNSDNSSDAGTGDAGPATGGYVGGINGYGDMAGPSFHNQQYGSYPGAMGLASQMGTEASKTGYGQDAMGESQSAALSGAPMGPANGFTDGFGMPNGANPTTNMFSKDTTGIGSDYNAGYSPSGYATMTPGEIAASAPQAPGSYSTSSFGLDGPNVASLGPNGYGTTGDYGAQDMHAADQATISAMGKYGPAGFGADTTANGFGLSGPDVASIGPDGFAPTGKMSHQDVATADQGMVSTGDLGFGGDTAPTPGTDGVDPTGALTVHPGFAPGYVTGDPAGMTDMGALSVSHEMMARQALANVGINATPQALAGIIGNDMRESTPASATESAYGIPGALSTASLNPNDVSQGVGSFGIAQWNRAREAGMLSAVEAGAGYAPGTLSRDNFATQADQAAAIANAPASMTSQMGFQASEIAANPSLAALMSNPKATPAQIAAAMQGYEGSANIRGDTALNARNAHAVSAAVSAAGGLASPSGSVSNIGAPGWGGAPAATGDAAAAGFDSNPSPPSDIPGANFAPTAPLPPSRPASFLSGNAASDMMGYSPSQAPSAGLIGTANAADAPARASVLGGDFSTISSPPSSMASDGFSYNNTVGPDTNQFDNFHPDMTAWNAVRAGAAPIGAPGTDSPAAAPDAQTGLMDTSQAPYGGTATTDPDGYGWAISPDKAAKLLAHTPASAPSPDSTQVGPDTTVAPNKTLSVPGWGVDAAAGIVGGPIAGLGVTGLNWGMGKLGMGDYSPTGLVNAALSHPGAPASAAGGRNGNAGIPQDHNAGSSALYGTSLPVSGPAPDNSAPADASAPPDPTQTPAYQAYLTALANNGGGHRQRRIDPIYTDYSVPTSQQYLYNPMQDPVVLKALGIA